MQYLKIFKADDLKPSRFIHCHIISEQEKNTCPPGSVITIPDGEPKQWAETVRDTVRAVPHGEGAEIALCNNADKSVVIETSNLVKVEEVIEKVPSAL